MTLRDAAIQAMKELGFSEAKIASILTFMDTAEPGLAGEAAAIQVPPEQEQKTIKMAKDFFEKNHAIPMNN